MDLSKLGNPSNFIEEAVEEDLRNGVYTEVHTRFPPEPNGYMHIGHAKAVFVDATVAKKYGGKLNLRFDDTNPAKEDVEFVEGIQNDIHWLGFDGNGGLFFGSDYSQQIFDCAEKLIENFNALLGAVIKAKPAAAKGQYLKSVAVASTMGPGVKVNPAKITD